ncbi:Cytochrome b2, mitochondrial [Sphaceloma murrayae]|uniref:Oxidase FUB9 n=1 Tax=Sphaceloma murrayae TaxID=2082308 RepID=A0A2K1QGG2_9PEZI|nr:Cytochrome b2, mitochondrial [Sphaceloma murrayae]
MAGRPIPVPPPSGTDEKRDKILCISDLEKAASARLDTMARDFFNSGSQSQTTLYSNTAAFAKYVLRPRVLRDVSTTTTTTTVFGSQTAMPLCVSPAGLQAIAHPDGELATSRACAKRGVHMGISSYANHTAAQIIDASRDAKPDGQAKHIMQLYSMKDRTLQESILRRAEEAGCVAVFLTADSPVLGVRYNEWRNDFRTPEGLGWPIMEKTSAQIRETSHDAGFVAFNDDTHCWSREISWLKQRTKMEIWIKGVLTAEDVELAVEFGADGVVVSNHGGRQLDGVPATLDVLPECVAAARGRLRIHVDGGIRSGTDIFKCLALGAECCWVGRPAIWGLAYDGEAGVDVMLETFHTEFKRCMQLCGCKNVKDISKAHLGLVKADGPLARL